MGIGHNGISIEDVRLNCGTVGYNGHTMPKVDGLSFSTFTLDSYLFLLG